MAELPCQAMVLTAGLGTRLHPLTQVRAKPAIPVGGEPMIRRIIRWLAKKAVGELTLNLHHLPETVAAVVGDGSDLSARVRYSWEQPAILGSAGGPRLALPVLGADTFFIINGDTLTDVDLRALFRAHAASAALATLALIPNAEPDRYGGVHLDGDGAVETFVAAGAAAEGSFHFIGVQVATAEAFQSVEPGSRANTIGGVYDALIAARPGSIRGFVSDASFWDVGTVADYVKTSKAFSSSSGPLDVAAGRRVEIDPSATVTQSILWDDVTIGPECRIERSIVTDRVRVPARSHYRDAALIASADGRVLSYQLAP
jgi:mannose-1-phosphate guanylyltransferase